MKWGVREWGSKSFLENGSSVLLRSFKGCLECWIYVQFTHKNMYFGVNRTELITVHDTSKVVSGRKLFLTKCLFRLMLRFL